MLCAKFCWNLPSGSGEEDENVKSLQQRQRRQQRKRRTTDKFLSEKLTWAFGSGELKKLYASIHITMATNLSYFQDDPYPCDLQESKGGHAGTHEFLVNGFSQRKPQFMKRNPYTPASILRV